MKKFFKRPFRWAIVYSIFLLASTSFILLKAFILPDLKSLLRRSKQLKQLLQLRTHRLQKVKKSSKQIPVIAEMA